MQYNTNKLFWASCMALLVTSLSFGIRAGILGNLGAEFGLSTAELGIIAATAFWGFPLAVVIGGFLVDIIGMKRLLLLAFIFHFVGIVSTIFSNGFLGLFLSTLLIGIANGTVEAACNPLVASLYPNNKTTKLNHFHLWFPGGIVLGTLIVMLFNSIGLNWQWQMAMMFLPTIYYGVVFMGQQFPVTERVAAGVSSSEMYKSLIDPLFFFMIACMFGTAITELFTGQWIEILLKNITQNALLILTITTGVMVIGRAFAGPIVHRLAPQGVLLISTILATIGLYILGHSSSAGALYFGALIFGAGVCYFWPTMLGFVAEYLPKTGAVGLNLMGGAGMFAVSIYMVFMSGYYDRLVTEKLPQGMTLKDTTPEALAEIAKAKVLAGPEIINVTTYIPAVLILAFAGLYFVMKNRPRPTGLVGH